MNIARVPITEAVRAALSFVGDAEAVALEIPEDLVAAVDPQRFV